MTRHVPVAVMMMLVQQVAGQGDDPVVIPVPNGGFEEGLTGWRSNEKEVISSLSQEQAASGAFSLKIVDRSDKDGSEIGTERIPLEGAGLYELRLSYYPVSGSGLGIYVRLYDAAGQTIKGPDPHLRGLGGTGAQWQAIKLPFYTTEDTVAVDVYIHSYMAAQVEGYLDDFSIVRVRAGDLRPPWEGQYKIRSWETERLTAADVVGPDGIVYPNWTLCGVQGGIPQVAEVSRIEDFGGRADDDTDDSQALSEACEAAGAQGGGAVVLGAGTYYLDRPVTVRSDGVVIRGQGADKTKLIFRYSVPESGVGFFWPPPGSRVGRNTRLEMHCDPTDLMKMTMLVDDTVLGTWERSTHSGNTFGYTRYGRDAVGKVPDGQHILKGIAQYKDGSEKSGEIPVTVDSAYDDQTVVPGAGAAITFAGPGWAGDKLRLAADGKRGDTQLSLESVAGLSVGDCLLIDGPATERWKTLTQNACEWGTYRRYEMLIEAIEGNTIRINQPLRIEFPVIDGSYVQRVVPIRHCGIEDLYIEQTENLWISTVLLSHAWNCWARGVRVRMCGRNPVYGSMAKWCEIRDCVFDDAWYKGGGGTAYTGWEHSWDCLMDGVETFKMRHAPLFQWAASGCVIRNGVFHESDGQWHSGWTNENLFENCAIDCKTGNGAYGFGMWASPPDDTAHGPNGPRNVVYGCDTSSPRTGLWMGGMNENWLILYNRFVVDAGQGVYAQTASFDHIIRGNVFVLKDETSPMVFLRHPDCIGVEVTENKLYGGSGEFLAGFGRDWVELGNEALPLSAEAPRPQPPVPSIFQWQRDNAR